MVENYHFAASTDDGNKHSSTIILLNYSVRFHTTETRIKTARRTQIFHVNPRRDLKHHRIMQPVADYHKGMTQCSVGRLELYSLPEYIIGKNNIVFYTNNNHISSLESRSFNVVLV